MYRLPQNVGRAEAWREAHLKVASENLKCCPLCGALNSVMNGECFVCTWHGEFHHDTFIVSQALDDLMDRCPELADAVMTAYRPVPWWSRVWSQLTRRRMPLDIRA